MISKIPNIAHSSVFYCGSVDQIKTINIKALGTIVDEEGGTGSGMNGDLFDGSVGAEVSRGYY